MTQDASRSSNDKAQDTPIPAHRRALAEKRMRQAIASYRKFMAAMQALEEREKRLVRGAIKRGDEQKIKALRQKIAEL